MACLAGIALLVFILGAICGLGWIVIQPLGRINRARVKIARFQLLDVFWLVLLLQPSLVFATNLFSGDSRYRDPTWLVILALIWICVVVAWYAMTGALSKAGVTSSARRAAAVLLILPMIGVVNPLALVLHFVLFAYLTDEAISLYVVMLSLLGELAFIAALFGCRRLSRWIATGMTNDLPEKPLT